MAWSSYQGAASGQACGLRTLKFRKAPKVRSGGLLGRSKPSGPDIQLSPALSFSYRNHVMQHNLSRQIPKALYTQVQSAQSARIHGPRTTAASSSRRRSSGFGLGLSCCAQLLLFGRMGRWEDRGMWGWGGASFLKWCIGHPLPTVKVRCRQSSPKKEDWGTTVTSYGTLKLACAYLRETSTPKSNPRSVQGFMGHVQQPQAAAGAALRASGWVCLVVLLLCSAAFCLLDWDAKSPSPLRYPEGRGQVGFAAVHLHVCRFPAIRHLFFTSTSVLVLDLLERVPLVGSHAEAALKPLRLNARFQEHRPMGGRMG